MIYTIPCPQIVVVVVVVDTISCSFSYTKLHHVLLL